MYKEYLAEFWYSTKALNNSKVFFSTPTGGIYGEVRVKTFRNVISAHYLPHSSEYVAPLSIDIVRSWFKIIGYGETVPAKWTLKKSFLPPRWSIFWEDIIFKINKKHKENVVPYTRFLSLLTMHKMKEGYRDDHMLAICDADMPVVFKAPKTSSKAESVSQGTKPGAKSGYKKLSTSSKPPSMSSREATKGGSCKAPTSSKTGHSKKRKETSSAMDSNLSQSQVSTLVDTGMHKKDQQATGGPTSLGVTSEARANPQLNSGMSASNLNKPIYSVSFIVHSKFASGCDASADSITEADPRLSAPSDFVPQQHSMNEGTKNTSYDHLFASIDLHVLADKTKSVSEGFKDLDSPEDDLFIVVDDSDEDEETQKDEVHHTPNAKTEDTLHKLELEKNKAKAALLKAQPFFPNVEQLNELLVKSLKIEFSNILSTHDFSSSLPTELKDLPFKLNELTGEVASVQAKLKTLDALPSLLLNVTQALNKFAQVLDYASSKARDQSVPSVGQADTMPAEGEKSTNQATISQLFQKRAEKNKYKGKKAMSSKDAEYVSTESDSDDETTHVPGSMVESSKKKELKKLYFVTKSGEHVHLTGEHISAQKKIEEEAKVEAAEREREIRKEELIDLLGPEVVNKKGPITLKVPKEDDTSEIIPEFKASDLHLTELGIDLDRPLSEQDPLDRLNDLENKKRKHDFVTIEDFRDFSNIMLYTVQEIFFRLHQGPGLDDHARTFSSLLLAKIDKRNLNPLKQMRVIEQLRQ
ncbi:hypothetical protein Tco_0429629 [Tanacetum coccineum]